MPVIQDNEIEIIKHFIKPGDRVLDVGANEGLWSKAVIDNIGGVMLDIFEPIPEMINTTVKNVGHKNIESIFMRAVGEEVEKSNFWVYPDLTGMSGLNRRPASEENKFNANYREPYQISVDIVTLDTLYNHPIGFIKIDTEGNEIPVLRGARNLIEKGLIKTIQFEYGLCTKENGYTLKEAFEMLKNYNYVYRLPENTGIEPIMGYTPELEDYVFCNYVFTKENK